MNILCYNHRAFSDKYADLVKDGDQFPDDVDLVEPSVYGNLSLTGPSGENLVTCTLRKGYIKLEKEPNCYDIRLAAMFREKKCIKLLKGYQRLELHFCTEKECAVWAGLLAVHTVQCNFKQVYHTRPKMYQSSRCTINNLVPKDIAVLGSSTRVNCIGKFFSKKDVDFETEVLQEVEALWQVRSHPNFPVLKEIYETSQEICLVIRKVEGCRLSSLSESLSLVECKSILKDMLLALTFLHSRNFIHGRISARSIFCSVGTSENFCSRNTAAVLLGLSKAMPLKQNTISEIGWGPLDLDMSASKELPRDDLLAYSQDVYRLGELFSEIVKGPIPDQGGMGYPTSRMNVSVNDTRHGISEPESLAKHDLTSLLQLMMSRQLSDRLPTEVYLNHAFFTRKLTDKTDSGGNSVNNSRQESWWNVEDDIQETDDFLHDKGLLLCLGSKVSKGGKLSNVSPKSITSCL